MKKIRIIPIICIILLLSGCSGNAEREVSFTAMDTVMTLRACGTGKDEALAEAKSEIERLDDELDALNPASPIARLNGNGSGTVSPDGARVISAALDVSVRTDGAFDITIAPVMELWDFPGGGTVPDDGDIAAALEKVSYRNIRMEGEYVELAEGSRIDLGGIAKGYAGDVFRAVMEKHGVRSAMAYLGGNVILVGAKPDGSLWRVAVQDPLDESGRIGVISAGICSIVTSGGYQRYFESGGRTYHHIIDPETGRSADSGLISVTVISSGGVEADGLSTALFVMGEEKALELWRESDDFEMILVTEDRRVLVTGGIEFEEQDGGYAYETVER